MRFAAPASRLCLVALVSLAVAGCMGTAPVATAVAPAVTPTPDAAILGTRAQLETALKTAGFGLIDYRQAYRPPETPALAAAPRAAYQVPLAQDPNAGVLVVYDLGQPTAAAAAGRDFAAYLASGPIRVEFPPDTRLVLRQLGSTLVFYSWSAASSTDPNGGKAADALNTVGQGFGVR